MKCPVCEAAMASVVCSCGYDESRNYEKYPSFGKIPSGTVSVSGLRDRQKNLVRCGGCGNHGFSLNIQEKKLCCLRCGRALAETELKLLCSAMGWEKAQPTVTSQQREPQPRQHTPKPQGFTRADPKQIVSIAVGWYHTVALYADGTVAAVGNNDRRQCEVSSWKDIVAISAGYSYTTGLKKDGTVVQTETRDSSMAYWKDIVAIANGYHHTVGLKRDGTVVAAGLPSQGRLEVHGWRNIQAIAAGDEFTLGLEKSGRVVIAGNSAKFGEEVRRWYNIQAIAAGYDHCAALDRNGNILVAGAAHTFPKREAPVTGLDAGGYFTAILRTDGTVDAVGVNYDGRIDVKTWRNVAKIASAYQHTVGLKADGTLVATGSNQYGQCDVDKLIRK